MYKKILLVITTAIFSTVVLTIPVFANEPSLKATSAILAMANGDQILYDKNPHQKVSPSGLTKLMTSLVAYEKYGMEELITITDNISEYLTPLEPSINLKPGEQIKSGALINAVIIGSANDAAIALALHCGGSVEEFTDMMNQRAELLSLSGTHFTNPTGNHDEQQYSTASDLLVIYKNLCAIPLLNKVIESTNTKIDVTNKSAQRTFWTSNSLTSKYYSTKYYYPYAKGGKSVSSSAGGFSIISGAYKGTSGFICVVLGSTLDENVNYSFVDARELFEYGFKNFTLKTIVRQDDIIREVKVKNARGSDRTLLFANNTLRCFILNDDVIESVQNTKQVPNYISAPVTKGDIIGNMQYTYNGRYVGEVKLNAGDTLSINRIKYIGNSILWFLSLKYIKLFLAILITAIVVYVTIIIIIVTNAQKKNKRRKRR